MLCLLSSSLIACVWLLVAHPVSAFNGNTHAILQTKSSLPTNNNNVAVQLDVAAVDEVAADNDAVATTNRSRLISADDIREISQGGVAIIPDWLPPHLVRAMRADARQLFEDGQFQPDGLTNTARSRDEQGFTQKADRQTFRGGAGWDSDVGDCAARGEFASRMRDLRRALALGLGRPSLEPEGTRKHEMTYNWYEPGAKLGRHLDEHHEETKGVKGWQMPTRRSVTWLVYLNDGWEEEEGGALRCFPRDKGSMSTDVQVGAHEGNLQVGWVNGRDPVFLDCFRPSGGSALYRVASTSGEVGKASQERCILSVRDFDVPAQPIDFASFLKSEAKETFSQISTSRLDPRFASATGTAANTNAGKSNIEHADEKTILEVRPAAGTLVVFDSVSLPHLVREVTGKRQRIAATGWFHEDSQFVLEV
eukprot:CAMPEP_0181120190 /NCGR_PEP_ID=MMETSP1071-20121207/24017_1 /TAXON_ID=35127 /ORGANISM="Thalassiosira sp., Strain NH16" /LENGTH=421 /DNA_ID=CAMNT_0023204815 /DNA_START=15 /DNA_END=1280 /DNA_ORIENTATION=+